MRTLGPYHIPRIFLIFLCWCTSWSYAEPRDSAPDPGCLLVISAMSDVESKIGILLNLRRNQGWKITVWDAEKPSPDRVAAWIADERKKDISISHVLLVGPDSQIPMSRRPCGSINKTRPDFGLLTDDVYGIPDATGTPQIAVGRLSAKTPEDLSRLAAKIVRYEENLKSIQPKIALFTGRQPASEQPGLFGISPQQVADGMASAFINDVSRQSRGFKLEPHTAFPGPFYSPFADFPKVFCKVLETRPAFVAYAGHANRSCFATYHSPTESSAITQNDISDFSIKGICGPFVSGGCSMVGPEADDYSIGEELLFLSGGPVAVVGFPHENEDYCVAQMFEIFISEFSKPRRTTLGDLVLSVKQRLARQPQSPRSLMIQIAERESGEFGSESGKTNYVQTALKNSALITLLGDPLTTVVIP